MIPSAKQAPDILNIFAAIPEKSDVELFDVIARTDGVRIERIVSYGQVSPDEGWYDQDEDEWVILISGTARILFDGESTERELSNGDYIFIPAHCRHKVTRTSPSGKTVWLAVHIDKKTAEQISETPGYKPNLIS